MNIIWNHVSNKIKWEQQLYIFETMVYMRIALISDIHGNLEALKSNLQDIEKRNF